MVEWKKLGEVCETITPPKKLTKENYLEKGLYPVIDQGQSDIVGYTDDESALLENSEYVLFGDHTRYVKFFKGNFAQGADGLKILKSKNNIKTRYFFYAFQNTEVPSRGYSRHWSIAKDLLIPIPSLQEQERIVEMLDTFTQSIDNLKAQIEQRRKQYEHYRDQLLDLEGKEGVEMKKLGEVGEISAGGDAPQNTIKDTHPISNYHFPVYSNGKGEKSLYGYSTSYSIAKQAVTISARGTIGWHCVREANFTPIIRLITVIPNENLLSAKYLDYALYATRMGGDNGGIPQLTVPSVKNCEIPLPSLQEQERIVGILDTFEASIVNLEAQLEQRQKQYEYYREKLLTFE